MTRRLFLLPLLVLALTACDGGADVVVQPTVSPTATATATPAATPAPSPTATEEGPAVRAFFVRSTPEALWVEPETRTLPPGTVEVAAAAVSAVLEGPHDEQLTTLAPAGTSLLGADLDDGVLRLDLSGEVRTNPGVGAAGEEAFAQQLAHTGAQFDTVDAVRLLVDGQPIAELWGHLDWSQPLAPDLFALSPVTIETITVDGTEVTVAGESNTFEATVELTLTDADGLILTETFTTATCGTGCRGTWEHTFTVPGPGRYLVIAREPDPSGGEGRPPFATERMVEVG